MTQTITVEEGRAYVFVAVEHANSEVVGIHATRSANRFEALEPVRQGVHGCFGAIAPGVVSGTFRPGDRAKTSGDCLAQTVDGEGGVFERIRSDLAQHP